MAGGIPPGKCREDAACHDHPPSIAAAAIDEADQQTLECHRKPKLQAMAAVGGHSSQPAAKIGVAPGSAGAVVKVGSRRGRYCKIPPESSAVLRRRLTSSLRPPPSASTERTSDRSVATQLTHPSASTSP